MFVLLGFLSACSTFSVAPYFQTPDWQAEGKLAVRASKIDGGKNQSLSFRWRQKEDASLIEFFSPLGQRIFLIQKINQQVSLVDQSGAVVETDSIANLAYQQLGVYLPLDDFAYLMFETQSAEALAALENAGWRADSVYYSDDDYLKKLVLINSSGTKLIIVVKHFE